ncbi:antitoxin Xre/MbcA/ParS toxin-binding domain-containing protein [Pseudomonas sp. Pseu.R1]|uniref:antitoxin Xre/MbcA/ParS toxin-binding domain-containing protein n=1 Tax=Pseudomonas sp. Pseu.R1 TaxID=3379818 RepID=UPI003B94220F
MQQIREIRPRKAKRLQTDQASDRLTAQQSAIAFQFAKTLEHSTLAFGSQELAEKWLSHPCRHLADLTPLDLIDNAIGYELVNSYLERIITGVYQ